MTAALEATLLTSNPAAFRAAFEYAIPPATKIARGKVMHAEVIAGVYGFMILLSLVALYIRVRLGRMKLFRQTRQGVWRPNSALFMIVMLVVYCALWIGLILGQDPMDERLDRGKPLQVYKTLVFVPLSYAGWIQVYATISAIPFTQGLINTRQAQQQQLDATPPAPIYQSRLSRFLESALLRNLLLIVIPLVHTSALVPSAILAGQAEMRIYSSADAVYPLLDYAVDNGWTAQSLMQCGAELMEVQEATDRYRHHMWACCVVFLIWVALDLAAFIPAALTVRRLMTRQLSQLRRSLTNAHNVRQLYADSTRPPAQSTVSDSQDVLLDDSTTTATRKGTPSPTSLVYPQPDQQSYPDRDEHHVRDFELKIAKLVRRRRVFGITSCATVYTMIMALCYSSFGLARGYWTLPGDLIRDLPIYLPFYCFMLPIAIPSTILTTYIIIKDAAVPSPSARLSRPSPRVVPKLAVDLNGTTAAGGGAREAEEWELPMATFVPRTTSLSETMRDEDEDDDGKTTSMPSSVQSERKIVQPKSRPSDWSRK